VEAQSRTAAGACGKPLDAGIVVSQTAVFRHDLHSAAHRHHGAQSKMCASFGYLYFLRSGSPNGTMPRVALTSAKLVYAIATENSGQAYVEPAYLFSGTFAKGGDHLRKAGPGAGGRKFGGPSLNRLSTI
jgi:hypothetical protein